MYREERASIESALTFATFQREDIFDGDELIDVFETSMSDNNETSTSFSEVGQFVAEKRQSGNTFDGRELVKVFQQNHPESITTGSLQSSRTIGRPALDNGALINGIMTRTTKSQTSDGEQIKWKYESSQSKLSASTLSAAAFSANRNNNNRNSDNEDEDIIEYIDESRPYDIICGRNNGAQNCVGNRRFRITIMMNLKRYMDAPNREDKSCVIKSVIDLLLNEEEVGARFIKKVGDGMYVRLKERQIREKVGHAFREMIALSDKETKRKGD